MVLARPGRTLQSEVLREGNGGSSIAYTVFQLPQGSQEIVLAPVLLFSLMFQPRYIAGD